MHFYREKYGTLEIKIPPKYHPLDENSDFEEARSIASKNSCRDGACQAHESTIHVRLIFVRQRCRRIVQ